MIMSQVNREGWTWQNEKDEGTAGHQRKHPDICPQLPGTLLRIFIPPGAVINLLNLLELTSPGGICIILRVPLLGGALDLSSVVETIQKAGGTVEIVEEQ